LQAEQLEPRWLPTLITLASFNGTNGANPYGSLIEDSSGNLFGTTEWGGPVWAGSANHANGTVFEVQQGSGNVTTLASFNGANGDRPMAGLVLDGSGNLFGTTWEGGIGYVSSINPGDGTVFEVQQGSGNVTTLVFFDGANGQSAEAGLVEDSSGNFFGNTNGGGYWGDGTVFEVQQGSGTVTTLATFDNINGNGPLYDNLIEDSSGNLFGTTTSGPGATPYGYSGDGTVFEVQQGSGTITTLASFNGTNGLQPSAGLVEDSSGNLFGTTSYGGSGYMGPHTLSGDGTVFEVQHGSGTLTTLATFNGTNGANPYGGLIEDSSGNLFGTTAAGGPGNNQYSDGTVFEVQHGSGTITTLAAFNGTNGANPGAGLVEDSSGNFFGTTIGGGASGYGTVFEVQRGPSITTNSLANWTVNQPGYRQTIAASGGTGTLAFSTTAGTLPPGLTLGSAGVVAGLPTIAGTYSFTLTATFTVGGTASQSYTVTINPAVTLTTTLPSGSGGTAYNRTIGATGGTGTVTFSATGALPTGLTLSSAGVLSGTPSTAGSYTFTVTATDAVGASASQGYTVTISPLPFSQYLVTVVGSSTIQAGTGFLVAIQAADTLGNPVTSYSGPTTVVPSLSPTTSAASSLPTTVSIGSNGFGLFLATLDQVGTYTISVANGSFTGITNPVTVTPGPAVKLGFTTQPANTPTGVVLPPVTVQVEDQFGNPVTTDSTDAVTLTVATGPGPFTAGSTTNAILHNGMATFNNLMLTVPGAYTLSEIVPTLFIGPNSTAFSVTSLQVVPGSFAGSPSGFSLQFNAPFLVNSLTPVLFGQGFGATAPVPSVTLTQTLDANGMAPLNPPGNTHNTRAPILVEGSVVLNTATNSLTFVATNTASVVNDGTPILPDGTYVVDVKSSAAANGFQAQGGGGGFLDGLGNGTSGSGAFTTTFTVNTAAVSDDVVWVPATADGPGQALSAPGNNQAGGGYPVYLNDSTGTVTSVQVTLNYDPTLLTVTGATSNSALPGSTFTLLGSSTLGHAVLQYTGTVADEGDLTPGPVPLGFITATVPSGTTATPTLYKAKDLLHLSSISINGGAVPAVGGDALHLVAYVGDADGNGAYTSNDAVLITRAGLQTDSGFTAYPLVDPVIVADTDGSGYLPADAALQANEAGVNIPTATLASPPIPSGVTFQVIANNVDPTVSIPSNLHLGADGTVTVPVMIDDAHPTGSTGLIRANLALTYDPSVFSVSAADVHLGSVLAAGSGWSVVPTIDAVTGQIAIALSSSTPISSSIGGSLVTIDFHLIDGTRGEGRGVRNDRLTLTPGLSPVQLVASVNPNGQYVTTELEDAQGTFTLTPAPTNRFDPRIDGMVVLTGTPAPASVTTGMVEATTSSTTAPLETRGADSRAADAPAVDTTNPAPFAVAPEASTEEVENGRRGQEERAISLSALLPFSPSFASLTGLVFQFGNVLAVAAPGGIGVGQPLTAPWLQTLVRGTLSPLDPAQLVRTVRDALERVLASQVRMTQVSTDDLDRLNWDEVSSDLDGLATSGPIALLGHCRPGDGTIHPTTPAAIVARTLRVRPHAARNETIHPTTPAAMALDTVADRASLDQYFAQSADDTDQLWDDE